MSVAVAIGAVEARRLVTNPAIWVSVIPAFLWAAFVVGDALGEHFLLSGHGVTLTSTTRECVLPLAGFDTVTPWWHVGYLVWVGGLLFTIATASREPDRRGVLTAISWTFGLVLFGGFRLAVYQRFDGAVQ